MLSPNMSESYGSSSPNTGVPTHPSVGAKQQAHQLAKMRVTTTGANTGQLSATTPITPVTPVAVTTPSFFSNLCTTDDCMHQDLQLAAELGKTLLERNRELESVIRGQQAGLDDKTQEIEYLSKQTAALREVNESRLKIYEALEISIQELEKTNQKLNSENAGDRKKIRSLCGTIESLEARNEELQRSLEEAKADAAQKHSAHSSPNREKRSDSDGPMGHRCSKQSECRLDGSSAMDDKLERLNEQIKELELKLGAETERREAVEHALTVLSQEHGAALEQLAMLQDRHVDNSPRSLKEELAALKDEEAGDERICSKCLGCVDETSSNPTVYELSESIEDGGDTSISSDKGALVRLANGAMAWGSQDSLASLGQMMTSSSAVSSSVTSPAATEDGPHNSLLSELDTQYRILIEKYEALLDAREKQDLQHRQELMEAKHKAVYLSQEAEDLSGPMSLTMTSNEACQISLQCQRCATCTCDVPIAANGPTRPKSNMEEFSEVETSSSGFSEGECRIANKTTQTEIQVSAGLVLNYEAGGDITPTAEAPPQTFSNNCSSGVRVLDLTSPVNPCDKRFQAAPEYKQLFKEIFTVLKKTVDENDESAQQGRERLSCSKSDTTVDNETITSSAVDGTLVDTVSTISDDATENTTESISISTERINALNNSNLDPDTLEYKNGLRILKPVRPSSLDLSSNCSSRSSSKHRKRRRHKHRSDTGSQKQTSNESQDKQKKEVVRVSTNSEKENELQEKKVSVNSEANVEQSQVTKDTNSSNLCEKHRLQQQRKRARKQRMREPKPCQQISDSANQLQQQGLPQHRPSNVNEVPSAKSRFNRRHNLERENERHQRRKHRRNAPPGPTHDQTVAMFSTAANNSKSMSCPSAEVAKLRQLEMTYAEVLKKHLSRAAAARKC